MYFHFLLSRLVMLFYHNSQLVTLDLWAISILKPLATTLLKVNRRMQHCKRYLQNPHAWSCSKAEMHRPHLIQRWRRFHDIIQDVKTIRTSHKPRKRTVILSIVIGAALYIVACFIPYIQRYPLYPVYTIKCGRLPITASTFAGSNVYSLPGDLHYGPKFAVDHLFCSEQDALNAGFHRWEPYKATNQ